MKKLKDKLFIFKKLHTIKKKENNSIMETKFDQYGNKIPKFETIKEVYGEIVTKENNISLEREPTASLLSGDVDYSDEIDTLLIIKVGVTKKKKNNWSIEKLLCVTIE